MSSGFLPSVIHELRRSITHREKFIADKHAVFCFSQRNTEARLRGINHDLLSPVFPSAKEHISGQACSDDYQQIVHVLFFCAGRRQNSC